MKKSLNQSPKTNTEMKFIFSTTLTCCLLLITASCNKHKDEQTNNENPIDRIVQFSLFTDQDFSNDEKLITFRVSIEKYPNITIWDSVLTPMKIKDIPSLTNKITIEKLIRNEPGKLKVGFYYTIENVGVSWFYNAMEPWESSKKVDFNFR
jgi:hypothetical protein